MASAVTSLRLLALHRSSSSYLASSIHSLVSGSPLAVRVGTKALAQHCVIAVQSVRSVKTTTTVHPTPVYDEDDKVLEKVLKDRENSEDLVSSFIKKYCRKILQHVFVLFVKSYCLQPISLANPYEKPAKKCILCEHGIEPNYKNTKLLYQFVSPYTGMVYGRHITGLCKRMQEKVEAETNIAISFGRRNR
jgi:ribosomal protein S18